MFSKILLSVALVLFVAKFVFRLRFREIGRRLDRAVNIMIVLIVIAYGAHVGWWLIKGGR